MKIRRGGIGLGGEVLGGGGAGGDISSVANLLLFRVVRELVNGVIVKGLNGKPKTKESCIEICMMCVEIEKSTEMREELIPGLCPL